MGVNPVAKYIASNNTSQLASAYKANIDANSVVAQRIVDAFAPRAQDSPNMTVHLDAGYIFKGVTLTEVAAQDTGTITAPIGNPRIDRVVIDRLTGVVSVVTGTPNASPVAPAITTGKLPIAQVLIQTSSTSITMSMITDERAIFAAGRGSAGEENIGQWLKDDGSGNLTVNVNATLKDNGSGALTTNFFTESTLASGSSTNLGSAASSIISISGTTGITSFGNSASTAAPLYFLRFTGALTITQSSNILTPSGANIVTTAGTTMVAKFEGSSIWRILSVTRPGAVTAGAYTNTNLTVDATGAITAIANGSAAGLVTVKVQTFASSGTYTPSIGMLYCIVELVGGGGGGAGGGKGGSGAEYRRGVFTAATIGASQTVTIGSGGSGGSGASNGSAGGNSSIGSILVGVGGGAGLNVSISGEYLGVAGGSGGSGTGLSIPGQDSGHYYTGVSGGAGGDSFFGFGGAMCLSGSSIASPPSGYGSGGGGSTGGSSGAAGNNGIVYITEFSSQ